MMQISISQLATWDIFLLSLIGLGRGCACKKAACDICAKRCMLTLLDGHEMTCPILANDGNVYEMMAMREWIQKLTATPEREEPDRFCIIPSLRIHTIKFLRHPFSKQISVGFRTLKKTRACIQSAAFTLILLANRPSSTFTTSEHTLSIPPNQARQGNVENSQAHEENIEPSQVHPRGTDSVEKSEVHHPQAVLRRFPHHFPKRLANRSPLAVHRMSVCIRV